MSPIPPDDGATDLLALVHDELRGVAAAYMRRERVDHTLQPTALVNEAYLRLARSKPEAPLDRRHFFGIASRVMRQVLIDHARGVGASKRGDDWGRVTLTGLEDGTKAAGRIDLLALDAALTKLGDQSERLVRVVEFRYFAGMTIAETADALGVSHSTVESDWAFARSWLRREIEGSDRD